MTDTTERTTGQMYLDEDTRARLRNISSRRRRPASSIDWNSIWEKLELAAWLRDESVQQLETRDLTPRETLDMLTKCLKAADYLLRHFQNRQHLNWSFISEDRTSMMIRSGSPRGVRFLVEPLSVYRDELVSDIQNLREFTRGRRTRAQMVADCDHLFLATLFDIGHELFGTQIGGEEGPLIEFVSLAAQPVLGQSTPTLEGLRTFARRL